MRTLLNSTPSSSAGICRNAVVIPWPSSTLPVATVTVPSRSKCTRCVSRRAPAVSTGSFMGDFQDGAYDAVVRPAAAQVLVERLAHFLLAGPLVPCEQGSCGHGNAAHAVAALRGLLVDERLLHGMELAVRAEAFYGRYLLAGNEGNGEVARCHRPAVDQDEAGSAKTAAAAETAADQAEVVAQHVEERRVGVRVDHAHGAVDVQVHGRLIASPEYISRSQPCAGRAVQLKRCRI